MLERYNEEEREMRSKEVSAQMKQFWEDEQELRKNNIVPITGGKITSTEHWLDLLPLECTFICQGRLNFNSFLEEHTIKGRQDTPSGSITLLRENRREGEKDLSYWQWTDTSSFCNEHRLRKVLDD
jgi:hypothetical protein